MRISDYTIIDTLEETGKSIVYRAKRGDAEESVVIKILKSLNFTPTEIARLRQEHELIKNIDIEGIARPLDLLFTDEGMALVLEDFGGIPLKNLMKNKAIDSDTFYDLSIRISGILGMLHTSNVVHYDIKPANILVNVNSGEVKLTDFGITKLLTRDMEDIYDPAVIEGTLAYMSPEQTGRMNRTVDYRSDYYSLGITFYEMLTGHVPFKSSDPMEMIHFHIAQQPVRPSAMDRTVPEDLSGIVMKLLSKTPEERYQSGFGLMNDLMRCRDRHKSGAAIGLFTPGDDDIPIKFIMPQKLFGREQESRRLMDAFERACRGLSAVMLISGRAGIGKSALVNEIHKPVVARRGYFISGKYEQYRRDVPYSAIIQALQAMIRTVLTEGEERIALLGEALRIALSPNGRVISDVIPEIEHIIGIQPDVPALGPEESQNRFNYAFQKLLDVFARREHPLVMFLDDLQWADSASMNLLKNIFAASGIGFFLLLGAYRDGEIDDGHIVPVAMGEIGKAGTIIDSLILQPLDVGTVNQIIAGLLRCEEPYSHELAEIVHQKTGGNPFFIIQFLKILYDGNLLELVPRDIVLEHGTIKAGWRWDSKRIHEMPLADNVVELMAGQISGLEPAPRNAVMIASCLGSRFNLETLASACDKTVMDVLFDLAEPLKNGMILFSGKECRFVHDRVQQAAYTLIPESRRMELHLKIGRLLLRDITDPEHDDRIFEAVNHLNLGISLVGSRSEIVDAARRNLHAGRKSKSSGAYGPAYKYLAFGLGLLEESSWESRYDLALSLHVEAAEAAYLCADYDGMERLSEITLARSRTMLERISVYEIMLHTLMARGKYHEAIDTGLTVLRLLGVKLPRKPKKYHIIAGFIKSKIHMSGRKISVLADVPETKDPYAIARMRIMSGVGSSAYFSLPNLLPLIVFEGLIATLKSGNSKFSPFTFAGYGMILCITGDIRRGHEFGDMAVALMKKLNYREESGKVHLIMNNFIRHWSEHLRETLEPLHESYRKALESGDMEFAGLSLQAYCYHNFLSGISLTDVEKILDTHTETARKLGQNFPFYIIKQYHQAVLILLGRDAFSGRISGSVYDETTILPMVVEAGDRTHFFSLHYLKLMLNYIFQDYESSFESVKIAEADIDAFGGIPHVPVYYFFNSLTRLALCTVRGSRERSRFLSSVRSNQKKMKHWARHAPMNHMHKYLLVEAEIARVKKNFLTAAELYESAIKHARENGYIQEEAIACECAARFYLARGYADIAAAYMTRAYDCYYCWSAYAKLTQLERSYPQLIKSVAKKPAEAAYDADSHSGTRSDILDLSTIMKASQALSSEIELGRLLDRLMNMAVENAGAQKGFFLLENESEKKLYIEAEKSAGGGTSVQQSVPLEESDILSKSIIYYVQQTKENVVLHDACNEGIFTNDPYIIKHRVKSLLCSAIMGKGKLVGILYLENNLATGSFTPERIKLLSLLMTQAAISINNARLIEKEKRATVLNMEIEMAQRIQMSLLPVNMPDIPNVRIAYKYVPMRGVGGDFISIRHDRETNRLGLFICDVSGHGVPAALTASMISMAFDSSWNLHHDDPISVMNEMRRQLIGKMSENFFTACLCILDTATGRLSLTSAGHPPPVVIRNNGTVDVLRVKGRLITEVLEPKLDKCSIFLEKNDRIVLYTDGISEAENPLREVLDDDHDSFSLWLKDLSLRSSSPDSLCENAYAGVIDHIRDGALHDDFTVLAVEYGG